MPDNSIYVSDVAHLTDIFCGVYQSQCHSTAPSTHHKIYSAICGPVFNRYCGTGS